MSVKKYTIRYRSKFAPIVMSILCLFSFSLYQKTYADTGNFGGQINVSATSNSISLNWLAGTDSSGRPLDYTVEYRGVYLSTTSFSVASVVSAAGGQVNSVISNLNSNSSYNIRITPRDSNGTTKQSQLILVTTLADTQTNPLTLSGAQQTDGISLTWIGNTTSSQSVFGYTIEYRLTGQTVTFLPYNDSVIHSNQTSITNLQNGKVYDFRIAALDQAGNQVSVSNIVTFPFGLLPSVPNKPDASLITPTTVSLSWGLHPTEVLYGNKIKNYIVEYKRKVDSSWKSVSVPPTGTYTTKIFSSLLQNTEYEFRVSAVGDAGTTDTSFVESIITGKNNTNTNINTNTNETSNNITIDSVSPSKNTQAPGVPGVVNMAGDTNGIYISWVEGLTGGSAISSYVVNYKTPLETMWQVRTFPATSTLSEMKLNNLQQGVEYQVKIAAQNKVGIGTFSKVFTVKTGTVKKSCEPIITSYIKLNSKSNNQADVRRLQTFLRDDLGYKARVTGTYGTLTFDLVKKFQVQYKDDVLSPWKLTTPTGWVYVTTKKKINDMYCSLHS